MTRIEEGRAYRYAEWCTKETNHQVGVYIKKQAHSWIKIVNGDDDEAYFDCKTYTMLCKLLKIIIHPDLGVSMLQGLEDYGLLFIIAMLCTKAKHNDTRFYQTGLLLICRKNFKTFTAAIIFIILMITEPQFSRFFSVAPDFKLSNELRLAVRKILKSSPALDKHFRIRRDYIACDVKDSDYVPLAYSNDKMDGKLPTAYLADEAGAMDTYPVEAMRSGQITIRDKIGMIISTIYPNENNVLEDEVDAGKKVLDGIIDNKRRFSLIYEPNQEIRKDWETNDLVIYQSNPVAVSSDEVFQAIVDMRTMAILYENKRENYLCKHNNIHYKGLGTEGYVESDKVSLCRSKIKKEWWEGRSVYLGLDLAISDDNVAVAMVTEEDDFIYSKTWGFIPKNKMDTKIKKEKFDYKKSIKNGECFAVGDEIIDYSEVERHILSLESDYGVIIEQVGFDRHNAMSTAQKLEKEGLLEAVEVKQHSTLLHAPTKLLLEKILSNKFRYDENKLLENNFSNARCTEDTNKNKYVNKKRSSGKVDEVVANIIAIYLLQEEQLGGSDCTIDVL